MIGILVELALSWLLLWLFERRNLSALGIRPTLQRTRQFFEGLLLVGAIMTAFYWGLSLLAKNPYRPNPLYSRKDFWNAVAYLLRAVAYENLIFNGALLYILIRRIGPKKAVLVSAACFGMYHWFSFGLFGQPVQMAFVFLITGIAAYLMALAFERTRSVYLPFAIHFAFDFVPMILFSKDTGMGRQLLLPVFDKDPVQFGTFAGILVMVIHFIGIPLLIFGYLRRMKPPADPIVVTEKT